MRVLVFTFVVLSVFFGLKANALTASQVVDKVGKSVVHVMTFDNKKYIKESRRKYGSGVAVGRQVVATNCHVVRTGKYILVVKNRKASLANIIGSNDVNDICLLYVHKLKFMPVRLRAMHNLKVGEDVYSIGNPGAIENYLSRGIISKVSRKQGKEKIYSDVTTAPGSSGGGLFDTHGNLIGITTAMSRKNRNISISAPVDWVIKDLKLTPRLVGHSIDAGKASDVMSEQPGIQIIGNYGDSRIGLYKTKTGCFMHLPGRTTSGLKTSSALWFPSQRKSIYIFPFAKNMNEVLRIVRIQKKFLSTKNKKLNLTKHQLIFDGKTYSVYMLGDSKLSDPVLYVAFKKNPTIKLAEGDDFILQLCSETHCTQRVFNLWGFSDALVNYNHKCL